MCGLSGVYGNGFFPESLRKIAHRGRDDWSVSHYQNATISHVRLAIVGDILQPISGNTWDIFLNGYISNWKELDSSAKNDAQVVGSLFEKKGVNCIKELNGFFVIVAYNRLTNSCYIIRDRYGVKPIYYTQHNNSIFFASEIKAFLAYDWFTPKVNKSALNQWLVFHNCLTDETLFDGVLLLRPGSSMNLKTGMTMRWHNWEFDEKERTYKQTKLDIEDLLKQAIKRNESEAMWLSGGVDSTLIAKYSKTNKAYTASFQQKDEQNEAIKTALLYRMDHKVVEFAPKDANMMDTIYHLEDLRAGSSWSNYGLYGTMKEKTCLQGTGADEFFFGYKWRYDMDRNYWDFINRTKIGGKIEDCARDYFLPYSGETVRGRQTWDIEHFLHGILLAGDKLSMSNTIEDRVPFLDNDLVNYALTCDVNLIWDKKVLKDLGLPRWTLTKKQGFSSYNDYFNQDYTFYRIYDYIPKSVVRKCIKEKNEPLMWSLIAFEYWLINFIP